MQKKLIPGDNTKKLLLVSESSDLTLVDYLGKKGELQLIEPLAALEVVYSQPVDKDIVIFDMDDCNQVEALINNYKERVGNTLRTIVICSKEDMLKKDGSYGITNELIIRELGDLFEKLELAFQRFEANKELVKNSSEKMRFPLLSLEDSLKLLITNTEKLSNDQINNIILQTREDLGLFREVGIQNGVLAHVANTARLFEAFLRRDIKLLDKKALTVMICFSLYHDIGKLLIKDAKELFSKESPLTVDEFELAQGHALKTYEWLMLVYSQQKKNYGLSANFLQFLASIVSLHHERANGNGYPLGLKQGEINPLTIMFSMCDVFEAMAARRSYKEPFPMDEIRTRFYTSEKEVHFEETLIDKFFSAISNLLYLDDHELIDFSKSKALRRASFLVDEILLDLQIPQ